MRACRRAIIACPDYNDQKRKRKRNINYVFVAKFAGLIVVIDAGYICGLRGLIWFVFVNIGIGLLTFLIGAAAIGIAFGCFALGIPRRPDQQNTCKDKEHGPHTGYEGDSQQCACIRSESSLESRSSLSPQLFRDLHRMAPIYSALQSVRGLRGPERESRRSKHIKGNIISLEVHSNVGCGENVLRHDLSGFTSR